LEFYDEKPTQKKFFENKVYLSFSQQKNTAQKKEKPISIIFEKKNPPFDYRKIQKKTTVISSQTINQKKRITYKSKNKRRHNHF